MEGGQVSFKKWGCLGAIHESPQSKTRAIRESPQSIPGRFVNRPNTNSIIAKVCSFCNTLRDDGVSYGGYLEQLTYLLFLKMADEMGKPLYNKNLGLPDAYNWEIHFENDRNPIKKVCSTSEIYFKCATICVAHLFFFPDVLHFL